MLDLPDLLFFSLFSYLPMKDYPIIITQSYMISVTGTRDILFVFQSFIPKLCRAMRFSFKAPLINTFPCSSVSKKLCVHP